MTTKVTVEPAGHIVRITVRDVYSPDGQDGPRRISETETILRPGDPVWTGYATTSRTISVVDLDP